MSRLYMRFLGSPRVEWDGAPIVVDTRKAVALLAYLAVTGQAHQRDTLAVLLWPDYDQTSARAALRRTLSTLNKALGGDQESAPLEITRETIALSSQAEIWLDVQEFSARVRAASEHHPGGGECCPDCLRLLQEAVDLYREPFLAGFNLRDSPNFEEWQFFQEETLRRSLAGTLDRLSEELDRCGQSEAAVGYARRWLALDPLVEEAHRRLMLLYSRSGQRSAALRQYRECVRILEEDLGVDPLPETTRLYESILNREPGILASAAHPQAARPDQPSQAQQASRPPEPAAPEAKPALIGRDQELLRLLERYQQAATGDGRFAALEGEAGIGKTSLAEAVLSAARRQGARIIHARCYMGETGLAYAPFISGLASALSDPSAAQAAAALPGEVLSEAARLLPGLHSTPAPAVAPVPGGDGAQARFFESLRQLILALLAGPAPGVLFLDDLHWADTASIDLLTYFARRLRGAPVLVLAAWRTESGETAQSLDHLVGELARSGFGERHRLARLDEAGVIALVRVLSEREDQPEALGVRLFQESEGLPFLAVEYLRAVTEKAALENPSGGRASAAWDMPSSVRDLLHSRLVGLDPAAMQLLAAAAVIGRSFDFHTLRETSGRSEIETVDGLEQLARVGLIVEQPTAQTAGPAAGNVQYDFAHEKLRALIYEETSLARRRLLHRRVADWMARPQQVRADAVTRNEQAGLAAFHYEQAGLPEQAAEQHLLAGEQARRLFANVEAMAHFQAALAAGHPDRSGLYEAIGDLQTLNGEYGAAIASYGKAADLCPADCVSNLEHKLGNVHHRLGNWEQAGRHYQASLKALGEEGDPPLRVHLLADLGLVAHRLGKMEQALSLAGQALALAQNTGDSHALAQAYNALGVLARARDELDAAVTYLEAGQQAAEAQNDTEARIAALNNLALVYGERASRLSEQRRAGMPAPLRDLDRATQLARQALELCTRLGDRHRQAALHNNLADLLHLCGREEEAMQQLKQAVTIFAEIGGENDAPPTAEIWKLTEW